MNVLHTAGTLMAMAAVQIAPASLAQQQDHAVSVDELQAAAEPAGAIDATIPVSGAVESAPVPPDATPRRVGIGIEEIIVTAQKREESISDVPIAITALSNETLDKLGVTDTTNLGTVVPGFTAASSGYNTPVYTLRGIGFNDQTYSATSTVGIYVDEVNLPNSIMSKGANLDLQRVEVLKGPQGILYGRNTTGGLVNYISNKPTDDFDLGLKGSYARFDTTDVEGYVSGPLTDTLKYRVAARDIRSQEGWQYSLTRPDERLGRMDKQSVRAQLEWALAENLTANLIGTYWSDRSDSVAPQAIAIDPQNPLPVLQNVTLDPRVRNHPLVPVDGADPRMADWDPAVPRFMLDDHFHQLAGRAQWQMSPTTEMTVIAAYNKIESDGSHLAQTGLSVTNIDQTLFAFIESSSLEIRFAGEAGDDVRWQLGANYAHSKSEEFHVFDVDTVSVVFPVPIPLSDRLPPALGGLAGPVLDALDALLPNLTLNDLNSIGVVQDQATSLGYFKGDQAAIFGNIEWQFSDTLRWSNGLRFTYDDQSAKSCAVDGTAGQMPERNPYDVGFGPVLTAINLVLKGAVQAPPLRGECFPAGADGMQGAFVGSLTEKNLSGRTALDWKPSDEQLYYVSLARGFKSGAFPVVTSTVKESYGPAKQEELRAAEIGSKTAFFDRSLSVDAAVFYYDYRDKQLLTRLLDPLFGPLPVIKNAPKSNVVGVELAVQTTPISGLFLSAAGSYIKSEIKEFVSTNIDGDEQDFAGKPFNFTPQWQGTVLADYSFPIDNDWIVGLGADYSYTGKTNSRLEQSPISEHQAYGLLGARLRATSPDAHWDFALFGRNLTNEIQTLSIISAGDAVPRFVGMPRMIGVSVAYRMGS